MIIIYFLHIFKIACKNISFSLAANLERVIKPMEKIKVFIPEFCIFHLLVIIRHQMICKEAC